MTVLQVFKYYSRAMTNSHYDLDALYRHDDKQASMINQKSIY
ncbi:hypothetical protein [Streptococcus suis]|nr:hypothetical protein [Streptococcus suis]